MDNFMIGFFIVVVTFSLSYCITTQTNDYKMVVTENGIETTYVTKGKPCFLKNGYVIFEDKKTGQKIRVNGNFITYEKMEKNNG